MKTAMLIDCGASSSLINPDILPLTEVKAVSDFLRQGVQPDFTELRKSKITMQHALGTEVAECAVGTLNLSIGNWRGSHEFIFAKIKEKAILGMNFLKKHKAVVDMMNNVIRIYENNKEYAIYDEKSNVEEINLIIKTDTDIVLEPRSENLIKIKVENTELKGQELLFEPRSQTEQEFYRGILFATSYGAIDHNNSIAISILNLSDERYKLDKNTEIGTIEKPSIIHEKNKFECEENKKITENSSKMDWSKISINDKLNEHEKTSLRKLLKKVREQFSVV